MGLSQWYVRRGRIPRRTWWLHCTVPVAVLGVPPEHSGSLPHAL